MSEPVTTPTHDSPPEGTQARPLGKQLGERLRALRIAAGMTQTDVAGGRFSKEYISQIERGKTPPTEATVTWLADRLNVDPSFLSVGVTTEDRKSTRLNSSHSPISYAVFCLEKKRKNRL